MKRAVWILDQKGYRKRGILCCIKRKSDKRANDKTANFSSKYIKKKQHKAGKIGDRPTSCAGIIQGVDGASMFK